MHSDFVVARNIQISDAAGIGLTPEATLASFP
jgi:hypothetical protein